jgi:hypothetical protein
MRSAIGAEPDDLDLLDAPVRRDAHTRSHSRSATRGHVAVEVGMAGAAPGRVPRNAGDTELVGAAAHGGRPSGFSPASGPGEVPHAWGGNSGLRGRWRGGRSAPLGRGGSQALGFAAAVARARRRGLGVPVFRRGISPSPSTHHHQLRFGADLVPGLPVVARTRPAFGAGSSTVLSVMTSTSGSSPR